jgi:hypothetical protein
MGAAGLEPAKPKGAGFTARCVSRSATHPKRKRQKVEGRRQNQTHAFSVSSFCLHPSSFILHFTSLASYGSRTRSNTSTGCHAIRYTNETQSPRPQGEQGNRTLATTFTVSGAATTPNPPSRHIRAITTCHAEPRMYMRGCATRKRRDSNPHRHKRAATFSKRVRRNRYSPLFQIQG